MRAAYGPTTERPYADAVNEHLHAEWLSGPPDGTAPFVLLHGFTQSGAAWGPFAALLAPHRATLAVDLPGHGGSGSVRADLDRAADLLADLLERRSGPAIVVGYSMGGRVALHLALRHPDLVAGLVLVSATGGIDDPDERAERRAADERLADRIEQIGVDAFIDEWLAQPMFAALDDTASARDERRRNPAAGLTSSLRLAGTGTQEPLWGRLDAIEVPTLVIVGGNDAKFTALGRRLTATIGADASMVVIDDAGHNVPLERPDAVATAIVDWTRSIR